MTKLTVAERHYIESFRTTKTPKELAKDLGRNTTTVTAYISKLPPPVTPEAAPVTTQPPQPDKSGIVSRSGAVIMTQRGSEVGDDAVKAHANRPVTERQSKCTHIIDPSKPTY